MTQKQFDQLLTHQTSKVKNDVTFLKKSLGELEEKLSRSFSIEENLHQKIASIRTEHSAFTSKVRQLQDRLKMTQSFLRSVC